MFICIHIYIYIIYTQYHGFSSFRGSRAVHIEERVMTASGSRLRHSSQITVQFV